MNKFEEKEMKKIRPFKNNWYEWLINYIPEPIIKIVGGFKDTPNQTMYGRGKKQGKPKVLKQSEENKVIALGKRNEEERKKTIDNN